ncbi:MAG: uroporphyrinogen decarboxylase [Candidatus Zixiibacteriota bacterium]
MGIEQTNFIKACYGKNDGTIPIWIMRQAGRYLPEYMKIREEVSFLELCHSPKLIAEVVRQPIDRFGLDAGILFSDILTMLEPMGVKLDFPEGGPVIKNPIKIPSDIKKLAEFDSLKELSYVAKGIKEIKMILPDLPLIGFAGTPFTLACYLIEGMGSKHFNKVKTFAHKFPEAMDELLSLLARVVADYSKMQVSAGADAIQLFDSWGGILSLSDYHRLSACPNESIFKALADSHIPRILFVNNLAPYIEIVGELDCEVIGVDYRINLAKAAKLLPGKSIQGNLEPAVLFGTPGYVADQSRRILDSLDNHDNLIFNLGHGIMPETPIESVHALVETVHNYRNYE